MIPSKKLIFGDAQPSHTETYIPSTKNPERATCKPHNEMAKFQPAPDPCFGDDGMWAGGDDGDCGLLSVGGKFLNDLNSFDKS